MTYWFLQRKSDKAFYYGKASGEYLWGTYPAKITAVDPKNAGLRNALLEAGHDCEFVLYEEILVPVRQVEPKAEPAKLARRRTRGSGRKERG